MHIQLLLHHYGSLGVFFILLLEMIGIPFPAETTLVFSGIEWTKGVFHIVPLVLMASLGNIVGSTIAYGVGRFLGHPVIVKYGKYVGLTSDRLDKGNAVFAKYQLFAVLFGKFIAGIRVIIPYLAGINKIPFFIFSVYNVISAILWTITFIVFGKYIGIEWKHYHQALAQHMVPVIIVAVILVSLFVGLRIRRNRKNKRMKLRSQETNGDK